MGREEGSGTQSNLDRLFHRSYGGEEVAAHPGMQDEAFWPRGPMLPGVPELVQNVVARSSKADGLNLYFLLGGAGNGKSFAARELADKLGFDAGADDLARRTYTVEVNGTLVALLNDATIAPESEYGENQELALSLDLSGWIENARHKPVIAFCCVNRGIIIDEMRALTDLGDTTIDASAVAIMRWLSDPTGEIHGLESSSVDDPVPVDVRSNCIEARSLDLGDTTARLFAISVDAYSLLDNDWNDETPAEHLMRSVVEKCGPEALARDELCPIRANTVQLQTPSGIQNWTALIKAAEMASGRLFSYRDVWGLIALSTVGPRVAKSSADSSQLESVDALISSVRQGQSLTDRLDTLIYLSQFRLANSLFRAPIPIGKDAEPLYPVSTPYENGFAMVDPGAWGTSDSSRIEDAMSGIALAQRPSQQISDLLEGAWSPFDDNLEADLVEYCQLPACSDVVRRRLISWFGGYLARLVALNTGNYGNEKVLEAWKSLMSATSKGPAAVPQVLELPLRSLLFPRATEEGSNSLLIPSLAPRAEPIGRASADRPPILVDLINHTSVAIRARQSGGRVIVECHQAGDNKVLGRLVVDFALIRDALTWKNGREGKTESTAFVEPRLERCRASTINALPNTQRKLAALVNEVVAEVYQ